MRLFMLWVFLLVSLPSLAETQAVSETGQSRTYFKCLLKRGANPPNIPKADFEFCLLEAGVEDPGEPMRKERGDTWRDCLFKHAARLDDGVSPAPDIARAIIQLCPNEWQGYVESFWMLPEEKRTMASGLNKYATGEGVQAVLLVRRALREMKAKPTK